MSLVNNQHKDPKDSCRADIWWVSLDPTKGSEIQKTRPCVIINTDSVMALPVRLVVPLTDWKQHKESNFWCVTIEPTIRNGLEKKVVADISQTRTVSIERLESRIGFLTAELVEEIVASMVTYIEYE